MADEQNNNDTNNNSGINIGDGSVSTDSSALTSDPVLGKHLDIAIEAQDGKTAAPASEASQPETESGKKPDSTDKSGDNKDSKGDKGDATPQQQPNKEAKKEEGTHRAKDLTLPDGTVIKGGPERRFYEQLQVKRGEVDHLRNELTAAQQQVQQAQQQLQTIQSTVQEINGFAPHDLAIATRIFKDLQSDPVGAVRKMLAELVANGHTIEGIGQGVDIAAITRAVEARVAPLQTDQQPNEATILQNAQQEVNNFYGAHPDARPHDRLLAVMLRDNPGLELSSAYFQLKEAFAERGYDWSLTLEDNLSASGEQEQQQQDPNAQQKPLPNGRGADVQDIKPATEIPVAHENTDMGDIIKAAMRDAGMKID